MRLVIFCLSIMFLLFSLSSEARRSRSRGPVPPPLTSIPIPTPADRSGGIQDPSLPPESASLPTPENTSTTTTPQPEKPAIELDLNQNSAPYQRILRAGVPEAALRRLFDFLQKNLNTENLQDTYTCPNQSSENLKPCRDSDKIPATTKITIKAHPYAAIIDYTLRSTVPRLYLIDLQKGAVQKFHVTHGKGSGEGDFAFKFSNTKDSRQTSLGIFMAGGTYHGHYGETLRMYGLEKSNDRSYVRDIVLHPAPYANPGFANVIESETGLPFARLGLSWGCPAVLKDVARMMIPLLKDGGLIMHYQKDLMDEALNGREVSIPDPNPARVSKQPKNVPIPTPRPEPEAENTAETETQTETGTEQTPAPPEFYIEEKPTGTPSVVVSKEAPLEEIQAASEQADIKSEPQPTIKKKKSQKKQPTKRKLRRR